MQLTINPLAVNLGAPWKLLPRVLSSSWLVRPMGPASRPRMIATNVRDSLGMPDGCSEEMRTLVANVGYRTLYPKYTTLSPPVSPGGSSVVVSVAYSKMVQDLVSGEWTYSFRNVDLLEVVPILGSDSLDSFCKANSVSALLYTARRPPQARVPVPQPDGAPVLTQDEVEEVYLLPTRVRIPFGITATTAKRLREWGIPFNRVSNGRYKIGSSTYSEHDVWINLVEKDTTITVGGADAPF